MALVISAGRVRLSRIQVEITVTVNLRSGLTPGSSWLDIQKP